MTHYSPGLYADRINGPLLALHHETPILFQFITSSLGPILNSFEVGRLAAAQEREHDEVFAQIDGLTMQCTWKGGLPNLVPVLGLEM